MGKIYPSKVDWWIGLILVTVVIGLIVAAVPILAPGGVPRSLGVPMSIGFLAIAAYMAWIPFATDYEIGETELIVRCTFIRWRVPLDAIVEVFPTHNPLSSPACSLDRLRINYLNVRGKSRFVMISPIDKEDFLRNLANAIPGAELQDGRIVTAQPAA
jgi:hypothetical protein